MPTIKTSQGHDHALRSNSTTQHDYLLNKLHDIETTNFQTECIMTWNSLNTEIKNKPYEKRSNLDLETKNNDTPDTQFILTYINYNNNTYKLRPN